MLIPYLGVIWSVWSTNLLSKSFGKGVGYTIGLIFLPFIFYPLLGFGDAKYQALAEEATTVADSMHGAIDDLQEATEDARDAADDVAQKASDMVDSVQDRAADSVEKAADMIRDEDEETKEQ